MTPTPLIQIAGLEKRYRSRDGSLTQALGPVSLDIAQREFITIVGPSGCGKSTLLKLIAGLIERSTGVIRMGGREITGPQPDIGDSSDAFSRTTEQINGRTSTAEGAQ